MQCGLAIYRYFTCKFGFCFFQVTENLLKLLGTMKKWISEIPPVPQPQRFGNIAYRTWFERVHQVGLFSLIKIFNRMSDN